MHWILRHWGAEEGSSTCIEAGVGKLMTQERTESATLSDGPAKSMLRQSITSLRPKEAEEVRVRIVMS